MIYNKNANLSSNRNARKSRIGIVVSNKMQSTITVDVERKVAHPKFKKIVKLTTRLYAHQDRIKAKVGDLVRLVETRPISKLKRWRLIEILTK